MLYSHTLSKAILFLSIPFLSILCVPTFSQEQQYRFTEEIQVVPKDNLGEWVVGGETFVADENTRLVLEHPAKKGAMAEIHFAFRGGKAVATMIATQSTLAADLNDGPYVFWTSKDTAEVVTLDAGKVSRTIHRDIEKPRLLKNVGGGKASILLDPRPPLPPKPSWKMPKRLLAISDLEGNFDHARDFLEKYGVVDKGGHWSWGEGHLVLVGDLVDRGDQVTELMWFLRRIEREAEEAGGHVHYVLGNHEAMVMGGDLRYIHPKYHVVTGRLKIRYDQLYNARSDIGRWWRSKNGVVRVGNLLFVHGGYSPMLDQAQLSLETLNKRMRQGLAPAQPTGTTPATNPVLHQHGPFWYRGYFADFAAEWGGQATEQEIRAILKRHGTEHIVVGHTIVEQVGPIDKSGTVIGIDVKWSDRPKCQGLLQEDGKLWRVTMSGKRTPIFE